MIAKETEVKDTYIIGISVRTTNQNGQAATDLGQLWEKFFTSTIAFDIKNRVSEALYAVYTEYESNYQAPYTAVIGYEVTDLNTIPPGLTGIRIPGGRFAQYTAAAANPTTAVVETWQYIWQHDATIDRAYTADFEVYDGQKCEGLPAVGIYVALKA